MTLDWFKEMLGKAERPPQHTPHPIPWLLHLAGDARAERLATSPKGETNQDRDASR